MGGMGTGTHQALHDLVVGAQRLEALLARRTVRRTLQSGDEDVCCKISLEDRTEQHLCKACRARNRGLCVVQFPLRSDTSVTSGSDRSPSFSAAGTFAGSCVMALTFSRIARVASMVGVSWGNAASGPGAVQL